MPAAVALVTAASRGMGGARARGQGGGITRSA
jgi:hypothetical protein